jgi:dTDP-4-dehydrorhamnose reductase
VKVLIIGAGGQIGRALVATAPPDARISAPRRSELDLTNPAAIQRVVKAEAPDVVLNAAGYTAVDRAEAEPDLAREVNELGASRLAGAVAAVGARLLHYSTDYVFDGGQRRPYTPDDVPNPLNVYGATKLAGERAVLARLGKQAAVIRTAWVYAVEGHNFLLTMLRRMREGDEVTVVSDQTGTPTSAASAARAGWAIAARSDIHGILHWTDEGTASWFDFAATIGDEARSLGLLRRPAAVRPIATSEYPTAARRPKYSVLDCSGARAATGLTPEHWRVALRRTLEQMLPAEA